MEITKLNDLTSGSPYHIMERTIEILKAKNEELNIDISILKRLVYVLNVELEHSDSNNRRKNEGLQLENHGNLVSKPVDRILHWDHEDIAMIDPLLRAFQQTKEEKDQLVTNYKQVFDDLTTRCKSIILENDALREELGDVKAKAETTYVEWKKLHQELILVKEHNQLLTRQIKFFKSKVHTIESVYKSSLQQYENEKQELKEKCDKTKTELLLLKGRLSVLTEVNNQFKNQNEEQSDKNFYSIISEEIHGLSAELKLHNAKNIDSLKNKIKDLEKEKTNMDVQVAKLLSERDHLKGYVSAVELEARKLNSRHEELEEELQNAKKSQRDANKQIAKCMAFIRELVGAHNILLDQVDKKENLCGNNSS